MFRAIPAIAILIALTACELTNSPAQVKSKSVEIEGKVFEFTAPEGFCLDIPTLQMRRGALDADHVFANIDASNCHFTNSKFQPSPLTHLITISAAESENSAFDAIENLIQSNLGNWQKWRNGYQDAQNINGYPTIDYVSEINGFLILIRVTTLKEGASDAQTVLDNTARALENSNP